MKNQMHLNANDNCHRAISPEKLPSLIDTHCHLDCEPLYSSLQTVLSVARSAGVTSYVVPGVHPDGWERIFRISQTHLGINPAFGIHPMHADLANDTNLAQLAIIATKGIAIGEIGLDPGYPVAVAIQEQVFREQLRIALKLGLPVLVHCRHLFQRTLQIMIEEGTSHVGGIMHAFSGSPEMAGEFIKLGFAISLSGTITWLNAVRPLRLARELSLDSIVLETDAPDMPPHPFRKEPNQPARLTSILQTLAEIRGVMPVDIVTAAHANTKRALRQIVTS